MRAAAAEGFVANPPNNNNNKAPGDEEEEGPPPPPIRPPAGPLLKLLCCRQSPPGLLRRSGGTPNPPLLQVVDIWDHRPDIFPEELRIETRHQILKDGDQEEGPDAAQVQFEVPPAFLQQRFFTSCRPKDWSEPFCRQFGYVESHTCDETVTPHVVTVRYDRQVSGLLLQHYLLGRRFAKPPLEFRPTVEVCPLPPACGRSVGGGGGLAQGGAEFRLTTQRQEVGVGRRGVSDPPPLPSSRPIHPHQPPH